MSRVRGALIVVAALAATGCATVDPYAHAPVAQHLERDDAAGDCARLFRAVDARIDALGVRDAMAPRVAGFPYLRVDRATEALRDEALAARGGFGVWSELMARLDRQARAAELANAGAGDLPPAAALDACRYQLAVADHGEIARLAEAAHVPDDYSLPMRALGLYPLTRIPFAAGIRAWQERTRAVFDTPLEALPVAGRLLRYAPAARVESVPSVAQSAAFGLPLVPVARLAELLRRNAPVLEIDTVTDDDRIGALVWRAGEPPSIGVDVERPVAYTRVAHTRIAGRVHLQLVYTFWFPARPAEGVFDILAGELDGLVWRVTLGEDFEPIVYDAIHPCGCYHMFFPTGRVRARPQPETLDEGLFAPQTAPLAAAGERVVLRVANRTHYLQRVRAAADTGGATTYALRDDDELRSLPLPDGGRRSAFGPDGLVPGSERPERFVFWPMGIASAGQMRQWGRHATAFVGRRHFDDPLLLDRYFEVVR
ncbi:MAG: hypothetical protein OHK0044_01190 [Burkholderiaceae bacterium]